MIRDFLVALCTIAFTSAMVWIVFQDDFALARKAMTRVTVCEIAHSVPCEVTAEPRKINDN